jgi:hypothetical protein
MPLDAIEVAKHAANLVELKSLIESALADKRITIGEAARIIGKAAGVAASLAADIAD